MNIYGLSMKKATLIRVLFVCAFVFPFFSTQCCCYESKIKRNTKQETVNNEYRYSAETGRSEDSGDVTVLKSAIALFLHLVNDI